MILLMITFAAALASLSFYSTYGLLIFLIMSIVFAIYPVCLISIMFYYGIVMQIIGGIKKLFKKS